jgi:hypothetical protein
MRLPLQLLLLAAITAATPVLAQTRECSVAGTKIHWIADSCMSKLETDDEIAASSCINVELERVFTSDCVAKFYYKKTMCQLAISRKQRQDDINSCLADKEFKGSTVRNEGVGGG